MSTWRKSLGLIRSRLLYYRNPWQTRRLTRFYRDFIDEGDLCFDIGAHLGNRSGAWLKLGARVIAVEPQPHCVRFLKRKFRSNTDITLIVKAVGHKQGSSVFHLSSLTPTISTLADEDWRDTMVRKSSFRVEWDDQIEVEMTTLDELISKYGLPKFCKIDVEGYELNVLQGLNHPIPVLSLEYLSDNAATETVECLKLLNKLGRYEYNWSFGESLELAAEWQDFDDAWSFFSDLKSKDPSGDLYARLKNAS